MDGYQLYCYVMCDKGLHNKEEFGLSDCYQL